MPTRHLPAAGAWRGRVGALLATDALVLIACLPAAWAVRTRGLGPFLVREIQPLADYWRPGAVLAALTLCSLAFARLYEDRRYLSRLLEYAAVTKAVAYAMLAAFALAVFLKAYEHSRGLLLVYWVLA